MKNPLDVINLRPSSELITCSTFVDIALALVVVREILNFWSLRTTPILFIPRRLIPTKIKSDLSVLARELPS